MKQMGVLKQTWRREIIVLKLYTAVCLALVVGIFTMIIGFLNDARPLTILYRTTISILIFGCCGFFFGGMVERFLQSLLARFNILGQKVDIIGEQEISDQTLDATPFSPLTSDNLERVYRPKE